MLTTRLDKLVDLDVDDADLGLDEASLNPVGDFEFGLDTDIAPTQVMERGDWTDYQRKQLRGFTKRLEALAGPEKDGKLDAAAIVIEDWIQNGFNPVVFCRYIETAKYVGKHLARLLAANISKLDLQVVTSEDPDDLRKQRIEGMAGDRPRILIATDCLSEGINLQERFTAVLHYDLPWNPNRLEQREGRVDRFGQPAPKVKTCLLYGLDNPIDGIVLDVLLRKVREIKKATGINVPFPEDSQSIIDTITQSLLLNPDRRIQTRQTPQQEVLFDFTEFGEAADAKNNVTRKIDEAAKREKASRSIFAQNAIKAQEIEEDLRAVDEAIGDPNAVKDFVTGALAHLFGAQVTTESKGYGIVTANLPPQVGELLPEGQLVKISFEAPTPEGYHYMGRNHRFVEQLCQLVMANTISREGKRAARAAVIRTWQVRIKTTLMLFRCRNVIKRRKGGHQIVAEEMLLWGWRGPPDDREQLDHEQARALLSAAHADSNLTPEARAGFLENELSLLDRLNVDFNELAENQSKRLVDRTRTFQRADGQEALPSRLSHSTHGPNGDLHTSTGGFGVKYPSIRVEGAILSPDILEQSEQLPGQKPSDFGLDVGTRVKDEIARSWADAQDYWRIFQRKLETVKEGSNATTETRNLWMVPLMGLLRYDIEYQARGTKINGRNYAISHRATNRGNTPVADHRSSRPSLASIRNPPTPPVECRLMRWCRSSSTSMISSTVWSLTVVYSGCSATVPGWSSRAISSSTSTASSPMASMPISQSYTGCSTPPASHGPTTSRRRA